MSKRIPIVVVAFNRANALKRLLTSLNEAEYVADDVPLIISIDKGDNNQDVLSIAEQFLWLHGEKTVAYQTENLKLRKHILKCGNYSLQYGNVIILEDDLYVSKYFYQYVESALAFVDNDERIGGVSLYNHRFNVEASEPFEAIDDGYDNWYFQFASSWGQAWSKKQWEKFREWYDKDPEIENRENVPAYVRNWSASSWLKYFIAYLIEKDMYFIYPRISLTTNFGEAGTHVNKTNTNYQVSLQNASRMYNFSKLENSRSIYDAFYENVLIKNIGNQEDKIVVDLYGKKTLQFIKESGDYVVSRKELPYKVIKKFGCDMRPHEENIFHNIEGDDFFLYDLNVNSTLRPRIDTVRKVQYNLKYIDRSQYGSVLLLFIQKTSMGISRRLKKLINK